MDSMLLIRKPFRRRPPVDYWGPGPKPNRRTCGSAALAVIGSPWGRSWWLRLQRLHEKKLSSAVPRFADPGFDGRLASLIADAIVAAARRLFVLTQGEAS